MTATAHSALAAYFAGLEPEVVRRCFVACVVDAAAVAGFGVGTAGRSTGDLRHLGLALIAVRESYEREHAGARGPVKAEVTTEPGAWRVWRPQRGSLAASIVALLRERGPLSVRAVAEALEHTGRSPDRERRLSSVKSGAYQLVRRGVLVKRGPLVMVSDAEVSR
jgi:hypothetical protein